MHKSQFQKMDPNDWFRAPGSHMYNCYDCGGNTVRCLFVMSAVNICVSGDDEVFVSDDDDEDDDDEDVKVGCRC